MIRPMAICFLFLVSIILASGVEAQQDEFPVLTGPYLGQKPPGRVPELFAPDVLLGPEPIQAHSNIVFSPDGSSAYWASNGIRYSRLTDGHWTRPELVSFSDAEFGDDSPFISPDGGKLFFTSKRPQNPSDTSRKENVWIVDINNDGWSNAVMLPPAVNDYFFHWQVSVDRNGDIYFQYESEENKENKRDIYCSAFENKEYRKPEMLSSMINTDNFEIHPYINPRGDFIIFSRIDKDRLPDGRQDICLFISFKRADSTWTRAVSLKDYIKYKFVSMCPVVTPDGKYLFFLDLYNGQYQRYWMSADFVEELRTNIMK